MIDSLYQDKAADAIRDEANTLIGETGRIVQSNYEYRVGKANGLLRALEILKEVDRDMQKGD